MKTHTFEPFTSRVVGRPEVMKADWCVHLDVPFDALAGMTEDEADTHFCGRNVNDPLHSSKVCHRCLSTKVCADCRITSPVGV